ncbi:MAG: 2-dehydropantoate 2-reductase [Actinobacteria bacterium]|nr:2-dehydropantoate 2-reductase [Actinomycetota bacterium]
MDASSPQHPGAAAEPMRICVVGCGAVGSLFAAHLGQLEEVETWAYDVSQAHVDAINRDGLRLTGVGEVTGTVRATTDAAELPPCRFGIVATKALHTESAMAAVAHAFREGSVCSVQNGVGNEELIASSVERVILGTTFPAGHIIEPGVVGWDTGGETTIGPFEPAPAPMEEVELLAETVSRSGMPTRALADARGAQWTKVIFNAASNPLGALTGLTHGRLCDDPALRKLITGLVAEGKAVASALGITLDSDPDALIDHARKVAYDHKASMLQDFEGRRPTEIDFLDGGIARFGAEQGVPTPLNETIAALVKGVELSWSTA